MEEKVEKKFDFVVAPEALLTLRNLSAKVEIQLGRKKTISVILTGDKYSNKVKVSQADEGNIIIQEPDSIEDSSVHRVVRSRKKFSIIIFVPLGTNIFIFDGHDTHVCGVRGSIVASIKKQSYLSAIEPVNVSLKCSERAHCNMTNVTGDLKLTLSDHAVAGIQGSYQEIDITTNEFSSATINGGCYKLNVAINGSSFVNLSCKVKGRLKEKR